MYILTLSKSEFEILNKCLKSVDDELYNRVKKLREVKPDGFMSARGVSELYTHDSSVIFADSENGEIPMFGIHPYISENYKQC